MAEPIEIEPLVAVRRRSLQIRTKEWIYTAKGELTQVNELGQPENRPEKSGDHADVRKEMKRILGMIDGE